MGLVLGGLVIAFAIACVGAFVSWRWRLLAQVLRGSEIAQTRHGQVEFTRLGAGPVILNLHGGATGYDQTLALSWNVHEDEFTVLTPSRPGYLRTPLTTGATPEQAADAMASLLDLLGIDKVCVMGTSGGGPLALHMALRHCERVWALVLQSAVTQQFIEPRRSTHSLIGWVVFSRSGKWFVDFGTWVVHLLARYWPTLLIRTFLNASDDLDPVRTQNSSLALWQTSSCMRSRIVGI
jgi:pimeloyl-ACP methyl ester carboxylesterase